MRRDGAARSRPRRVAPADDCGAEVRARATLQEREQALTTVRADAAESAGRRAARGAGPQRSHPGHRPRAAISTRSWPANCRPRSRSCSWRCADIAGGAPPADVASLPHRAVPRRPRLASARRGAAPVRPPDPCRTGSRLPRPKGTDAVARSRRASWHLRALFAGFGNLVILDHGSQTFSCSGDLARYRSSKGRRASSAARRLGRRSDPRRRRARSVFRAPRRRSAG